MFAVQRLAFMLIQIRVGDNSTDFVFVRIYCPFNAAPSLRGFALDKKLDDVLTESIPVLQQTTVCDCAAW